MNKKKRQDALNKENHNLIFWISNIII